MKTTILAATLLVCAVGCAAAGYLPIACFADAEAHCLPDMQGRTPFPVKWCLDAVPRDKLAPWCRAELDNYDQMTRRQR